MGLIPMDPSQVAHHAYASCFLSFSTAPAKKYSQDGTGKHVVSRSGRKGEKLRYESDA